VRVVTAFQLLPERPPEIAEASTSVLADTALDLPAGEVRSHHSPATQGRPGIVPY